MQPLFDFSVNTKYKTKDQKVEPVDAPLPNEFRTHIKVPGYSCDPYNTPLTAQPPPFTPTKRLTTETVSSMVGPPGWLLPAERDLLLHAAALHEKAIAFDESQLGKRNLDYGPPSRIATIPHTPWQEKPFPIPTALRPAVIELIQSQLKAGLMEPSQAAYASKWFVIMKKNGKIRFIFDAQTVNLITIRDAGLPPNVQDYVNNMSGQMCCGAIDLLLGYLQEPLNERSRDLTTFRTPIGLYRLTRLPVGATNSVPIFQRIITTILYDKIPDVCQPFIDNIGIQGPSSNYNDERLSDNPGIRRWVWEHAVVVERILFRLEEARLTASGPKLILALPKLTIIGTTVSQEGKEAQAEKADKIISWPSPRNHAELQGFYGLFNYLRDYAPGCAQAEAILRRRLQGAKQQEFTWGDEEEAAFNHLKQAISLRVVLRPMDYEFKRLVIVSVDSSQVATGVAIWQEDEAGKRQPVVFDSIGFDEVEMRYSQPKLELRGVHKTLVKYKLQLIYVRFILEVDAISLRQTLCTPDLPSAAETRWVAFIKNFDFVFRHIAGKDHVVPDALSRRAPIDGEAPELLDPTSSLDLLAARIHAVTLSTTQRDILPPDWLHLVYFLENGEFPAGLSQKKKAWVLKRSTKFYIQDEQLRKHHRGRRVEVIFDPIRQADFMTRFHEELGHRGRDAVAHKIEERAWWLGLRKGVNDHVRSCPVCQLRQTRREIEEHHATSVSQVFQKVALNVVYMTAKAGKFKYLIVARDNLSGWVKARALRSITSRNAADFLQEDVLSRFGPVGFILTDNGSKFAGILAELVVKFNIPHHHLAPYNALANGMVERGHAALVETIVKATNRNKPSTWTDHHSAALWADRVTHRRTTQRSPYKIVYGVLPIMPVNVEFLTWIGVEWSTEMTIEQLIKTQTRQLERCAEDLQRASELLRKARENSVRYIDSVNAHKLRHPLNTDNLVLLHNSQLDKQWGNCFEPRWFGPYRVVSRGPHGGYRIAHLDGTAFPRQTAAGKLRRFYPQGTNNTEDVLVDIKDGEEPVPEAPPVDLPLGQLTQSQGQAPVDDSKDEEDDDQFTLTQHPSSNIRDS